MTTTRKLTAADCEKWNEQNPVGVPVKVQKDNGTVHNGVVKYPAQMLSGHTAVVWVTGITGCYALERVTPR